MVESKNVAITGIGCCCGAGSNSLEVWQTLAGQHVHNHIAEEGFFAPHPASPLFNVKRDFLKKQYSPSITAPGLSSWSHLNRTTSLALAGIAEAIGQSGLPVEQLQQLRVGIALGTTVGCTFHNEGYYIDWKANSITDHEPVLTYLRANLAERIHKELGLHGPRAVITNACASGTDAIGLAKLWLDTDLCDVAIAGGADEISRIACHGFSSLMLFSQDSCQPFDSRRKGLNLGEGAGIMLLEKTAAARTRKAAILGWILSYGIGCDAYHPTAPHPQGKGLQRALSLALRSADVTFDDIGYINAHGTGTQANDLAELTALQEMGLTSATVPAIASTKGMTGHTLGAAGGIEAVITLMTLQNHTAHGTAGCTEMDPKLPLQVLQQGEQHKLRHNIGISQSLAFGGSNSALVLEANQ